MNLLFITPSERSGIIQPGLLLMAAGTERYSPPRSGSRIVEFKQGNEITSAVKSPILGKVIALARLDVTHAKIGSAVKIGQLNGQQKCLKVSVARFPHFDPSKIRVKDSIYGAPTLIVNNFSREYSQS